MKNHRAAVALMFFALGVVLVALVIGMMTDGHRFLEVWESLKPVALISALFCMWISYLSIALSFSSLLRITKHQVGFIRLSAITLVSSTFNYVVSTGGLSSLAVRLYLFKSWKIPLSVVVPVSVAQSMMTNLILTMICLSGLLFLETQPGFHGGFAQVLIWVALGILVVLVVLMAMAFFHAKTRRRVLSGGFSAWEWFRARVLRHPFSHHKREEVIHRVEQSVQLLHRGWGPMGLGLFWVSMDWLFTALTLYECFLAVGVTLSVGYLLVGFSLAFLSSTVNILPGGLGIMEGLITVTYSYFGIPPEKAMVAILLFRVIYFMIPLAVSAALYLDTIQRLLKRDLSK